ncbi:MAG: DUF3237 family protein [Bacillota bacterium]|nr:DUF3237 family protein [Bacillota bacterium]
MKKLFELTVCQNDDIEMGQTCSGEILVSPTGDGAFSGELLQGKVVPAGMGTTCTPAPGINDIDTVMLLQADDGAYILMELKAIFDTDEAVEARLMKGEVVDPDEYYYKGVVSFRTGSDKYRWLERKVCVCTGIIESWEKLVFEIYML